MASNLKALDIFAGPRALARLQRQGLSPVDVRVIPAAAGGPKGLTLLPLDRYLFGEWLPQSQQPIDLIGASIGAWRIAAAALERPVDALYALEDAYIHQDYDIPPGRKTPTRAHISERFSTGIRAMFNHRVGEVLDNPRYGVHIVTSRGRRILHREGRLRAPLGYLGAYLTNVASRKAMSAWLERAVFSSRITPLPFADDDYRTRRYALSTRNFAEVVQASCSIPFVLNAVHDIPGAAPGAYWDGGITDYHLHLDYRVIGNTTGDDDAQTGVVLYPHFQRAVVPGWLDKSLKWRHHSSQFLDDVIVLAPNPQWVAERLPNGKLPDRSDFPRFGTNLKTRVRVWQQAVKESERLRDEFAQWVSSGDLSRVQPL